jgi:thiol-disulfide isomerase/thioredoxin
MSESSAKPGLPERPEPLGPAPIGAGSKSLVFWLILAAFALGLMLIIARRGGNGERPSGAADPLVGQKLPEFRLAPLTGDPPPLLPADLSGKVTLVNFWGTWCPPCMQEFPHLDALRKELAKHDDFRFVSVSCKQGVETDIDELRADTENFLKRQKTDLPTYYDPEGLTRIAVMDAMQGLGFGYPMTLLFDREGIIRGAWRGYGPGMEDDLRAVTEKLLAGQK